MPARSWPGARPRRTGLIVQPPSDCDAHHGWQNNLQELGIPVRCRSKSKHIDCFWQAGLWVKGASILPLRTGRGSRAARWSAMVSCHQLHVASHQSR